MSIQNFLIQNKIVPALSPFIQRWAWDGKKDFDLETLQTMNIQTGGKLSDEDLKEFLPAKKRTSLGNKLKRDLGLSSTHKAVKGKSRRMLERFGFTHENYFPDE